MYLRRYQFETARKLDRKVTESYDDDDFRKIYIIQGQIILASETADMAGIDI